MKDIIFLLSIFIYILCSSISIKGQDNYEKQSEIFTQVTTLMQDHQYEEALSLLDTNKELFHIDEFMKFVYDHYYGILLFNAKEYYEARTYISEAISFLELNMLDLLDINIEPFLSVYYFIYAIDLELGYDVDILIKELEHAKSVYERYGATSGIVYTKITSELECNKDRKSLSNMTKALQLVAEQKYEQSIPLLHSIIDYLIINEYPKYNTLASFYKTLADCYSYIGDYKNAEVYYNFALNVLDSNNLKNEDIYRITLDALSILYCELHNYDKARILNDKARIYFEESLDFGDNYVRCVNNAALIQKELGYNSVAKTLIDVALRQAKQNLFDKTAIRSSLIDLNNNLSEIRLDSLSFDDSYYIGMRIVPYVTLLSNSSVIYSELGYFSDALRAIKESIKVSEEYGLKEAMPYNNMGMLYFYKSKFPQSVEWFLKSYNLSKTPYESDEIGMNTALGLYLSKDERASAFSADVSEKMRKSIQDMFAFMSGEERAIYWKHFENYLPILNLIIYENGNTKDFGAIYDNILESKGLLLRSTNAIRDAVLNSGNETDIADYIRIGQLKQQLLNEKDEETRLTIEKEIEAIDKRLTQHVNAYADFAATQNIRWEEVRNALTKDDAAIEFYNIPLIWGLDSVQTMDGEPRYCAVILRNDYKYPHIIPLCKESQLEELDKEDLYETDSIYNLIWRPLEEELRGVKNIYFAADRELHKIGIEYAHVSENMNISDKYNLYRVSSTRVLAENKSGRLSDNAVLYGGLRYDLDRDDLIAESRTGDYHPTGASRAFTAENSRYGVKYLPGTLKEVTEISQSFHATPRVITDISGTEESFKSLAGSAIDIIHLATHGFFWSEEDAQKRDYVTFLSQSGNKVRTEDKALMRSGLFFSGANIGLKGETLPDDVEDGVLTALELSNMNLGNVDMVVMSACESGLGETSGEGVFGLQRGFKLAGANTLLMSLWKVDDEATQILMTEFYKNYLGGKSKRESLQAAQKVVRETPGFEDPEYWAAFILLDALN